MEKDIKQLLKKYDIRPNRRLGQNFLISQKVIDNLIETAEINHDDVILEIGPGLGNLTRELAKKAKTVITIEKDRQMTEILKEEIKGINNIYIEEGDALEFEKPISDYRLVANLPFYITAPIIRKFLERDIQPKEMVLIVQKEVGERICAKPPKMNLLALSVQVYGNPQVIHRISRTCFYPEPEVDSVILKITPRYYSDDFKNENYRKRFFEIAKAGFSHPRKQVVNNFSEKLKTPKKEIGEWLLKNNISPMQRAETLSIDDWIKLVKE